MMGIDGGGTSPPKPMPGVDGSQGTIRQARRRWTLTVSGVVSSVGSSAVEVDGSLRKPGKKPGNVVFGRALVVFLRVGVNGEF